MSITDISHYRDTGNAEDPPVDAGAAVNNKLIEGNDIYRLMVERILDSAIFMLDPDGLVMTWNAGGERILGYCGQEIIGRHVSALYPHEEARSGKPERDLLAAAAQSCFDAAGW